MVRFLQERFIAKLALEHLVFAVVVRQDVLFERVRVRKHFVAIVTDVQLFVRPQMRLVCLHRFDHLKTGQALI